MTTYLSRVAAAFAAVLTRAWWVEVREASIRQLLQIVGPLLVVVSQRGVIDVNLWKVAALTVVGAEIVVIGRRLLALQVPDDAGWEARIIARALSAFAGSVLVFVLNVQASDVLFGVDWPQVILASVSAMVISLLHGRWDPATSDVVRGEVFAVDGVPVGALGGETDDVDHDVDPAGPGA